MIDNYPNQNQYNNGIAECDISQAKYNLSAEELDALESGLVKSVKEKGHINCIVATWIRPNHKYANIPRAYEAQYFPEVAELGDDTEENTLFLVLVDTRDNANRVVHATTISRSNIKKGDLAMDIGENEDSTGFYVIDDLIDMGNFTAQEFRDYYESKGFDLSKCISVETNFRIGERTKRFHRASMAELSYMAVMKMFLDLQPERGKAAIFASINRPSLLSFRLVGLRYEPLMGRQDLITSESLRGLSFHPVCIPYDNKNHPLFEKLSVQLPELVY